MATVDGIVAGEVTHVYRRWSSQRARAGSRQRTPRGVMAIDAVTPVELSTLTDADARASGHPDLASLLGELEKREGTVFKIDLHFAGADPRLALRERADLTTEELADLRAQLARKDGSDPWTRATLELIAARPARVAAELATALGQDKQAFKRRVRQLKDLGLTIGLERGYELSPRGRALLAKLAAGGPGEV